GLVTKPLLSLFSLKLCFSLTGLMYIIASIPMVMALRFRPPEKERKRHDILIPKEIFHTDLIKLMALFIVISGFNRYMVDFLFSRAISGHFQNQSDLASFFGIFTSASKVSILICQLFFSTVITYLSLGNTLRIISFLIILLSLLSVFYSAFWIIVAFQFIIILLSKSMEQPSTTIFLGAIPSDIRPRIRFLLEGICYCFGVMITGAIIAGLNCFSVPLETFFCLIFIAALIYFFYTGKINQAYLQAMTKILKTGVEKEEETIGPEFLYKPGKELFEDRQSKDELLELMDKERDSLVISNIISLLGNMEKEKKIYDKIIKSLERDDPVIISRAIGTLAGWGEPDCLKHIDPFIYYNNSDVKSNAILSVVKLSTEKEEIERAIKELINMLKNDDEHYRSSGVALLGELGLECFIMTVSRFLKDPSLHVRRNALTAAMKLRSPSLLVHLSGMLEEDDNKELYPVITHVISSLKDSAFDDLMTITSRLTFSDKEKVFKSLRHIEDNMILNMSIKSFSISPLSFSVKLVELLCKYGKEREIFEVFKKCFLEENFSLTPFIENIILNNNIEGISSVILQELAGAGGEELIGNALSELIEKRMEEKHDMDFVRQCFAISGIAGRSMDTALAAFKNITSGDPAKSDLAAEFIESSVKNKILRDALLKLAKRA
ncbi:MAG: MFS transporter, partial [Candidatus Eremiobacterota bacterium]